MRKLCIGLLGYALLCTAAHAQSTDYWAPYDGVNTTLVRGDIGKRVAGLDKLGRLGMDALSVHVFSGVTVKTLGQYAYSELPITLTTVPSGTIDAGSANVTAYVPTGGTVATPAKNCAAGSVYTYAVNGAQYSVTGNTVNVVSDGLPIPYAQLPVGMVAGTSTDPNCTPAQVVFLWGIGSVSVQQGRGYLVPPVVTASPASVQTAALSVQTSTESLSLVDLLSDAYAQTAGLDILNGNSLRFHPAIADNVNGTPYMFAQSGSVVSLKNSGGTTVNFDVSGLLSAATGLFSGTMTHDALVNTYRPTNDGTTMYCSDCVAGNVTGVVAYYHASTQQWLDAKGFSLSKTKDFANITSDTQWVVCSSGCDFTSPLDAWSAGLKATFSNAATLTILISRGTYNLASQFYTDSPKSSNIIVLGDTANPDAVMLNFTNTKGTNQNGFLATGGGIIKNIDGVAITTPSDGTGALQGTDSSGHSLWNNQSYGAGVAAYGSGSYIHLGAHVSVNSFYYSLVADNNGMIDASQGATLANAGDVNAMARGNGTIVCTPCNASGASDVTTATQLGSNYDAERGGSLYIDGSTGKASLIQSVVGLTGGHIWGHNMTLDGVSSNPGRGMWMTDNSSGEFTGTTIKNYAQGAVMFNGGFADLTNVTITNNTIGISVDGGKAEGSGLTITNNTTGIQVLHQGAAQFYGTWANMSGNATNFTVEAAGTSTGSNAPYTASSLLLQ